MTITSVSWQRSGEGDDWGSYYEVAIHAGLYDQDDLTAVFDANYIPGTRELVFSRGSLYLEGEPGEWVEIALDEPFEYPGTGNLVIEIQRDGTSANTFLMMYRWYTRTYRTVSAETPDAPAGYRDRVASMLRIDFAGSLAPTSWGAVKRLFP